MQADDNTTVGELRRRVQQFVDKRDWAKYHNPKDLAVSIAIEAAELLEHFQWVGEGQVAEMMEDADKAAEVRDELADIVIYCLSFANATGVELAEAVTGKIAKNSAKYPVDQVKGSYTKYTKLKKL